jgi:hypothetical protein
MLNHRTKAGSIYLVLSVLLIYHPHSNLFSVLDKKPLSTIPCVNPKIIAEIPLLLSDASQTCIVQMTAIIGVLISSICRDPLPPPRYVLRVHCTNDCHAWCVDQLLIPLLALHPRSTSQAYQARHSRFCPRTSQRRRSDWPRDGKCIISSSG